MARLFKSKSVKYLFVLYKKIAKKVGTLRKFFSNKVLKKNQIPIIFANSKFAITPFDMIP